MKYFVLFTFFYINFGSWLISTTMYRLIKYFPIRFSDGVVAKGVFV